MSDDDRDIDVESDDGDDSDSRQPLARAGGGSYYSQAEKRAHHNALERKRRDHIKDSFSSLRDAVPSLHGEKVASRAQILKKAAEYITIMKRKNHSHVCDIDDLKKQNSVLESQIRLLERAKSSALASKGSGLEVNIDGIMTESEMSDGDGVQQRRTTAKKPKLSTYHH